MGFMFSTGPELEFFLFQPDGSGCVQPLSPHDQAGYFDVPTDLAIPIKRQMVTALQAFGIRVEAAHHEVATGQHEIDFRYSDALSTADNAVTFRTTLKAVAQQNGLYATFMPKPIAGINGSGMHTHMSLADSKTGENVFAQPDDEYGLSDIAKHFIAGLLTHARGMCAVLAPLVNSYKRLVPGYEAPVYVSWARINRSALIRVPRVNVLSATRVELRCPDPSCNPYLAFAAMLAAGLDGVKRNLEAPAPREEDLYHLDESSLRSMETLPGSLKEALDELEKDSVIREALGKHVYDRFYEAKLQEWNAYRLQVSPWELKTYLTTY
jgi:glutamine synthetase